jgi:hypothetical protein
MSSLTADITSLGRPAVSEVCDAERLGGAPRRAETTRAQNWQVWLTARPTRRTQRSVVPQNRPYLRVVGWETGHVRQAHIWMFGARSWIVDLQPARPVFDAHRVGGHGIDRGGGDRGALMPRVRGPASAGPHRPLPCWLRLAGPVRLPGA